MISIVFSSKNLIDNLTRKQPDVLIFDRLYITQAYRSSSDLTEYSAIEAALLPYSPHTIILKVDEDTIAERIQAASEHRDAEWLEYWKTKDNTFEAIAQDYIDQQRGLLKLAGQSKLPYTVFDTTSHDYAAIAQEIITIVRR